MEDKKIKKKIVKAQKNELTEHFIYKKLASFMKDEKNKKILEDIGKEELKHYEIFKKITKIDVKRNKLKFYFYAFLSRIFGLTFSLKLMETGEEFAQKEYEKITKVIPEVEWILKDENKHEKEIISLLDEEKLKYVSSIVLGLNDALVELTGALAGFTFALQKTKLIVIVGFITGIAAAMSMAASGYLSAKQEEGEKNPLKSSMYTGIAYIITVLFLLLPYLVFKNVFLCLGFVMVNALIIILVFTFYVSVAKEVSFKKRFFEMASLSLSIAVINFLIGILIRKGFGIDV
ncbi:MAG TPA: VIT1/CCC1 transporter family protein [bacterium]|nr:VIT1/CCC1 transporter family protein [bacterium]